MSRIVRGVPLATLKAPARLAGGEREQVGARRRRARARSRAAGRRPRTPSGRAAGGERGAEDAGHAGVRRVARHPRAVDVVVAQRRRRSRRSRARSAAQVLLGDLGGGVDVARVQRGVLGDGLRLERRPQTGHGGSKRPASRSAGCAGGGRTTPCSGQRSGPRRRRPCSTASTIRPSKPPPASAAAARRCRGRCGRRSRRCRRCRRRGPPSTPGGRRPSTPATARCGGRRVAQVALDELGPRVEVVGPLAVRGGQQRVDARAPRAPRSSSASTTCEPMNPAPPVTRIGPGMAPNRAIRSERGRKPGNGLGMADVVLPVPRRARRPPVGARADARGLRADRGRQRIDGRLGRAGRVARRARRARAACRGFGAACFAGLSAATADIVCFMDCDALVRPRRPAAGQRARRARDAPTSCWARARAVAAAPGRCTRGSPTRRWRSSCGAAAGSRCTDLGPMRAARREPLLGLGIEDRRFGWPLEMVMRAARAGWRVEEVPVGTCPRRAARRSPAPCAARCARCATWRAVLAIERPARS